MNQKKIGVVLTYTSGAIQFLTTLLYTPVMLRLLGQSEYGLYQLVHSVVSYLGLLSLGFTAAYVRYYSLTKANGTEADEARLNGMFMTVFLIIAGIALICGSVMVSNIRGIFKTGLTDEEYATARILMIIMVLNLGISFPNSVFNCIILAHECFFFQRLLLVLQNLLNPFLTLPLLLMGYGSVGMVMVTTIITLVKFLADIWFVRNKLQVTFLFDHFDLGIFKDISKFTFFIFLNQIIDQINWNVDKFLLGRMIGTSAVTIYSLGAQINTMYVQMSTTISSVFVPQINRMVAVENNNHALSRLFTRVGRVQFMLLGLILSGFVFIGRPFMILWGGSVSYEESYYVALLLMIPVTVPLIQNLGIEIQRAKNMHQARSVVYFCIAIANIFISIPLIRLLEASGAAFGTAISLFLGNVLFMNWYYSRHIGLDIVSFWKSIAAFLPSFCVPLLAGALIAQFVQPRWGYVILFIVIYSIIYCISVFFLGMNHDEKQMLTAAIHKAVKR